MSTRQTLITTAAGLFADRGYEGVSVRDITAAAETNLGAVTYHFGSKEQLFEAVIEQRVAPLRAILLEVSQSDASPREKLSTLLHRLSMHILHHDPNLKVLFIEAMQGGTRLPKQAVESLKKRNLVVSNILQEGIDRGDFRPCDVTCAAWMYFGLIMPYVMHQPLIQPRYRKGPYPEKFVKHLVEQALDLFFQGIDRKKK